VLRADPERSECSVQGSPVSRILAAWEMGANMGHIDRLLLVARALRARGHDVRFVLRDLSRAHPRIAAEGFAMGQAPIWLPRLANPPPLGSYAAILAAAGWLDATGLAGLISGWRSWFDLLQPDVLIADHSPTAVLAARGLGMKVWTIGTSFEVPPRGDRFPPMAFWEPGAREQGAGDDDLVLPVANRALALHQMPPLRKLTDLFAGTHAAIATPAELAHYDGYPTDMAFCGPTYLGDSGVAPCWPQGEGPRVFAYLAPTHTEFRSLMAALREMPLVGLVHAKGLSDEAAARLAGPRLRFEAQPVKMDEAMAHADIVVSHASLGTVTAAFMAGKPQLVLPNHMEQRMTGRRIVANGIGLAVAQGSQGNDWRALLTRLSGEPHFTASARLLAARYPGCTPAGTAGRLADLVEASLPSTSSQA